MAPPNSRSSPATCRARCTSCAVTTAARSLAAAAALLAAACTGDLGGPTGSPPARLDYVDGAIEPILERGATIAIQGYGFGATQGQGAVHFTRLGGGAVAAVVPDSAAWSDAGIRVTVPDSAATGPLTITTAAGGRLSAAVHVLPRVAFAAANLDWQHRTAADFPQAPLGVALAAAEFPSGTGLSVTLFAAGGAEPVDTADTSVTPDSGVYVARAQPGGVLGAWIRQTDVADPTQSHVLPAPRAFAAAAVATRYNSRFDGTILYVLGGIDSAGVPQNTVLAADASGDSVTSRFVPIEALPAPVAGAIAVVRRGRVYVIGGTDSTGRPRQTVFVGRIDPTGHIDGWYTAPALSGPRAYGGAVVLDDRTVAFGGVADSVPPGGGLGTTPTRLATSDTAATSLLSGFVTGAWAPGAALLPQGRSQFATLFLGNTVLVVGGMYAGAGSNAAETLAADVVGDSLGPFATPTTVSTIWGQGGGTLVGPAGAAWRDADGTRHGIVLGGLDLATHLRRAGVWGF